MIEAEERRKLDELKAQVACPKNFTCLSSCIADLCESRYHSDLDILECLQKGPDPCQFAKPFGCTFVCTCPLRRYIAMNFDRWSAKSTFLLRHGAD